jgi:hypothetical protein
MATKVVTAQAAKTLNSIISILFKR